MNLRSHWQRPHGEAPRVFGHRGVRGHRPENTMSAFEQAAVEGAHGVELDVRLCGSGEVIVLHDRKLDRVSGGRELRDVERLTWDQLQHVDVGDGQRVPLLEEVLQFARRHGLRVNVELKHDVSSRPRLVQAVITVLRQFADAPEFVILSSFDPSLVRALSVLRSDVACAWLVHHQQRFVRSAPGFRLLGACAVHPERTLVTAERMRRWQRSQAIVNVWTVNDPEEAMRLAALGVDCIISDVPGVIKQALQGNA